MDDINLYLSKPTTSAKECKVVDHFCTVLGLKLVIIAGSHALRGLLALAGSSRERVQCNTALTHTRLMPLPAAVTFPAFHALSGAHLQDSAVDALDADLFRYV